MKFFVSLIVLTTIIIGLAVQNRQNLVNQIDTEIRPYIFRADTAKPKLHAYHALLKVTDNEGNVTVICGGTLISNLWILTDGHCVWNASDIEIYLGLNNPNDVNFIKITNNFDVVIHNGYYEGRHDIAAIKMPDELKFTENIYPATLPRFNYPLPADVGKIVWMSGFGSSADNENVSYDLFYTIGIITNKLLCSFGESSDLICVQSSICRGVAGSALIMADRQYFYLTGIATFQLSNTEDRVCRTGNSFPYTRIMQYLPWIESTTGVVGH